MLGQEPWLRDRLQTSLSRGSVQATVALESATGGPTRAVQLNEALARSYLAELQRLAALMPHPEPVTLAHLLHNSDLFTAVRGALPAATLQTMLATAFDAALPALLAMREAEGQALAVDLRSRGQAMCEQVALIAEQAPRVPVAARERLAKRLQELMSNPPVSEERIAQELALLADRGDVSEELTRLRHHLQQWDELMAAEGPVGRRLEFLIQEIQREINTLGAKANDVTLSRLVVSFKTELERAREQVQNVE